MSLLPFTDAVDRFFRRLKTRPKAEGVLLLSAGGLGDTVLFSLLLPRYRKLAAEGETVTVLLRRDAAKMAFLFPKDIAVEIVDFKRLHKDRAYRRATFAALYDRHYRLAVTTDFLRHPMLDEALIGAAEADQALAMEARPWKKYDTKLAANRTLYDRLFDSGPARVDKVLRFNAFADWLLDETQPAPKVRLSDTGLAAAATLDRPTVVIQPFSAVQAKQSPVALYEHLIDALGADTDVVIAAAPNDLDNNPDYRRLLDRANVRVDTSTFEEAVPLLRAAMLVVSVDTAMMHLATAVGAPTLCLASAAYEGEIVPYADAVMPDNLRVYYKTRDCAGCLGDCRHPLQDGMYPCVADLRADDAVAMALEMLKR